MFPILQYEGYSEVIGYQDQGLVRPIKGRIALCAPGYPPEGVEAGMFYAAHINRVEAIREKEDISAVLEGIGRELATLHDAVYEGNCPECRQEVKALWELPPLAGDLLAIPYLSVYSEYRGRGLGLATLWQLLRAHTEGVGIVALQARPLQFCRQAKTLEAKRWAERMRLESFDGIPLERARAKLNRHYGQLGFMPFGEEGLLLFNPSCPLPLPSAVRPWIAPISEAI
jgi:GNAT superfamily N-acetyltransferase